MRSGIDLSNLNGPPSAYRQQPWYQAAEFVLVQAIPRPAPNGLCGDQLRAATDDGKAVGVYTWLWHDPAWRLSPSVTEDQQRRLATVPDDQPVHMRPWLDIEDNQSGGWWLPTEGQRRAEVLEALAVLKAWADGRGLPQPGVYSSAYFRDLLYGGSWDWLPDGTPLWLAHYGIEAGSLIGGDVVGHQFTSDPIDMDVFLDSEFFEQGGNADVTDEERQQYEEKINGLTNALGYALGDAIAPLRRKTAPKYVKAVVSELDRVHDQYLPAA